MIALLKKFIPAVFSKFLAIDQQADIRLRLCMARMDLLSAAITTLITAIKSEYNDNREELEQLGKVMQIQEKSIKKDLSRILAKRSTNQEHREAYLAGLQAAFDALADESDGSQD